MANSIAVTGGIAAQGTPVATIFNVTAFIQAASGSTAKSLLISAPGFPSSGQQWPLGATLIATISGATSDPEVVPPFFYEE